MTNRRGFLKGVGAGVAAGALGGYALVEPAAAATPTAVAFHGANQAGITTGKQPHAALLALDTAATTRAQLIDLLRALTDRARFLTAGGTPPDPGIAAPPTDNGILGPTVPADRLTVTLGLGASLFDGRFGLAARRPAGLTTMPTFPDDHLVPAWCHGDLSLQVCADNRDTVLHAVRDITRATRGALQVRWRVDGFSSPPRPAGTPRNLMGFRDGTSNLTPADGSRIWTADGGTYQVVRIIRMLVEFWDRIGITEQENLIGRRRDSGAPMDGDTETDTPHFAADPVGAATPLTSHIRLANPRTTTSEASRILRRPYNYDRGMDPVGDLDQGLLFVSYQASVADQFETIQHRLAGEPLVDYIQPTGGGYFLVPPGVRDTADYFGSPLFT